MFYRFQPSFDYLLICFCKVYILLFSVVFHPSVQCVRNVDVRSHCLCPKDI